MATPDPAFYYWTAHCKNPACGALHVMKYIGQWDGVSGLDLAFPSGKVVRCPACHQDSEFHLRDLRPRDMKYPPPADYTDWF